MRILLIRMMGFGDVASILVPAIKIIKKHHPDAQIDVLTFGAGYELISLINEVNKVVEVKKEQWPDNLFSAIESFTSIAESIAAQDYDKIINYDTWFMPCFLAQCLKELKQLVEGNTLKLSVSGLLQKIQDRQVTQHFFESPIEYMDSTFKLMEGWHIPWWEKYQMAYPQFYLNHCCDYKDEVDISIEMEFEQLPFNIDPEQKVVALSTSGRVASKHYPHADELTNILEKEGFYVWGEFDGSVNMSTTLSRLHHSDLLITVPTSTQWLAKLAGCPSLIIPGPLPPVVLSAEVSMEKSVDCQYCFQNDCGNGSNFMCMNIEPEHILDKVKQFFKGIN